jgi:hypothetical protein
MSPVLSVANPRCRPPLRRVFWAVTLVCLGLGGCASCDLKGSNFADNSMADSVSQYRKPESDAQLYGVSAKSQQVEKDLGL